MGALGAAVVAGWAAIKAGRTAGELLTREVARDDWRDSQERRRQADLACTWVEFQYGLAATRSNLDLWRYRILNASSQVIYNVVVDARLNGQWTLIGDHSLMPPSGTPHEYVFNYGGAEYLLDNSAAGSDEHGPWYLRCTFTDAQGRRWQRTDSAMQEITSKP